jgi:hypothetical protein
LRAGSFLRTQVTGVCGDGSTLFHELILP